MVLGDCKRPLEAETSQNIFPKPNNLDNGNPIKGRRSWSLDEKALYYENKPLVFSFLDRESGLRYVFKGFPTNSETMMQREIAINTVLASQYPGIAMEMIDHAKFARPIQVPEVGTQEIIGFAIFKEAEYGNLGNLIRENRLLFNEAELIEDLIRLVKNLHAIDIAHLDLKPENIVVTNHLGKPGLRLIDFGMASRTSEPLRKLRGTF